MAAFDSEAFNKELQKNQHSKFLLLGGEALSRREAFDLIRQFAKDQGFAEKISLTVDRYFKWNDVLHRFLPKAYFPRNVSLKLPFPLEKLMQKVLKLSVKSYKHFLRMIFF